MLLILKGPWWQNNTQVPLERTSFGNSVNSIQARKDEIHLKCALTGTTDIETKLPWMNQTPILFYGSFKYWCCEKKGVKKKIFVKQEFWEILYKCPLSYFMQYTIWALTAELAEIVCSFTKRGGSA